jgi:hypothetical protein
VGNAPSPAMGSHNDAAGDDASDATPGAAIENGGDGTSCVADPPLLSSACTPALDALCQHWAAQAAVGAYGHSRCHEDSHSAITRCAEPNCSGCCCWCGPDITSYCSGGQVCASDTPNGPLRCIAACGR